LILFFACLLPIKSKHSTLLSLMDTGICCP